ncbi:MAG: alpha/beta fold hydrolase [Sulfitobacter sp.]
MTLAFKLTLVFGLLLGAVALVQWRAHVRETAAEAQYPPIGDIIMVDGIPVHAYVRGTGPDLVLIHGASGNLRDFSFDFINHLTDQYRVIAFDRPGLGWTGRLPGKTGAWNTSAETPLEQAALLQKAADIIGVKNPIVLGHSYGGAVTLAWGLARPDETAALVLVSAASEPWPGDLGWLYQVSSSALGGAVLIPLVTAFLPRSAADSSVTAIFAPQEQPKGYTDYIGAGLTLRRTSTRANAQQVNGLRPHIVEMQKQYGSLTLPIEVLHGDADTIVPAVVHAQVLIKDIPNGVLTTLPGLGHMPHHSNPDAIVSAINRAATRAGLR